MPPETRDSIWISDDGELDGIRRQLRALELGWREADDGRGDPPERTALLLTNSRHALASDRRHPQANLHVVVYDEVSRTLRGVLERSGCDLVLEQPLADHTLRLVVAQALYAGPERRRGPRAVMSEKVQVALDGRKRAATLVQLSLRGCGLLLEEAPRVGREISVTFPRRIAGECELEASGPVLSVRPDPDGEGTRVSMAFRLMNGPSRRIVSKMMARSGEGGELRPRRDAKPTPRPAPAPEEQRRDGPRRIFTRRVLAAGAGVSHVLLGRDLSSGGMRVRPDPNLALGDELKLAIHSRPGTPAIMVKAVVQRDDGDDGVVLQFRDIPSSIATRLEQIMENLPTVPDGQQPAGKRPGVLVTEVLERS